MYAVHPKYNAENKEQASRSKLELGTKIATIFEDARDLNDERKKSKGGNSCAAIRSNFAATSVLLAVAFFYRSSIMYLLNNI